MFIENVFGRMLMSSNELTEQQTTDMKVGLDVCRAFWAASMRLPSYKIEHLKPHGRCIYASMALVDILHHLGRKDAIVQKVGLEVRQYNPAMTYILNAIRVGHANYVDELLERRWNAHLIVRLGDVFIDPSIAQVRRSWNNLPYYSAMIDLDDEYKTIYIGEEKVSTKAGWMYQQADSTLLQVAYFDLAREQDIKSRGYRKAPDAKPEARKDVVREAIKILSNANDVDAVSKNAA